MLNQQLAKIIWAFPCENVCSGKCGQRRPRSDCASAQADQGLHCPLTESMNISMYNKGSYQVVRLCRLFWIFTISIRPEDTFFLSAATHVKVIYNIWQVWCNDRFFLFIYTAMRPRGLGWFSWVEASTKQCR